MKQINIERRESWKPLTDEDKSLLEKIVTCQHRKMDGVRLGNGIFVRAGNTAYIGSTRGSAVCYGCEVFNKPLIGPLKAKVPEPKYKMLDALLSGAENLVLSHSHGVNQCSEHEKAEELADMYRIKNVYFSLAHFKTENKEDYLKQKQLCL